MIPAHIINVKAIYALFMPAPFAQFLGTYWIVLAVCVLALCSARLKLDLHPERMTTMRNPFEFSKSISVATGFLCLALATGCSNKADEKMAEDVAAIRAIKEKEAAESEKDKRDAAAYGKAIKEAGAAPVITIPR